MKGNKTSKNESTILAVAWQATTQGSVHRSQQHRLHHNACLPACSLRGLRIPRRRASKDLGSGTRSPAKHSTPCLPWHRTAFLPAPQPTISQTLGPAGIHVVTAFLAAGHAGYHTLPAGIPTGEQGHPQPTPTVHGLALWPVMRKGAMCY